MRVGINGFGRIGRCVFRIAEQRPDMEIVAINNRSGTETMAHLLKYDSNYGIFDADVQAADGAIVVDGRRVTVHHEQTPETIPWSADEVDVVIESTGVFRDAEAARGHIEGGGAGKVLISAPGRGEDVTVVMGVNEEDYSPDDHNIISNASCTTNCLAPVAKVLHDRFGIKQGLMTTVHAYTTDQRILDSSHRDLRRARAAGLSIVPTSTGATRAVAVVLPELEGRLSGLALRVPTPTVSLVDLVINVDKPATADEVNEAFAEAARGPMKGIIDVSHEPLVSIDYVGNPFSAVIDAPSTAAVGHDMVKVLAWYDNEWGYAARLVDFIGYMGQRRGSASGG